MKGRMSERKGQVKDLPTKQDAMDRRDERRRRGRKEEKEGELTSTASSRSEAER